MAQAGPVTRLQYETCFMVPTLCHPYAHNVNKRKKRKRFSRPVQSKNLLKLFSQIIQTFISGGGNVFKFSLRGIGLHFLRNISMFL